MGQIKIQTITNNWIRTFHITFMNRLIKIPLATKSRKDNPQIEFYMNTQIIILRLIFHNLQNNETFWRKP